MAEEPTTRNSPLRILEIGVDTLFLRAVPHQTVFYSSSIKPRAQADRALGPLRMFRCLRDLRRRKFDLLVVHAMQYAPWHPRSILTALRDWHVRAPVALFGLFAWRFIHLFHDVPMASIACSTRSSRVALRRQRGVRSPTSRAWRARLPPPPLMCADITAIMRAQSASPSRC